MAEDLGAGVGMRVTRIASAFMLSAALIAGLTACSLMRKQLVSSDPTVRELQRAAALYYRDEYQPNLEKVEFTREGGRPGLGASWRANAIATVAGVEYHVIISPDLGPSFVGGDGMP